MSDWADKSSDDLGARIISGVVLIAFGLGSAFAGGPWIAAAAGAAVTAMSFEWARMSERAKLKTAFAFVLIGGVGAVMAASWSRMDIAFAWLALLALAAAVRRAGAKARLEAAFGVFYIGAPCAALVFLRGFPDHGLSIILSLFAIIWSADIFAYIGGRFIGGPKLNRNLSPNKTWTGLVFGVAAGALAGYGFALWRSADPLLWAPIGAAVAAIGLAGDLFESLLKRRFGVKDASGLIPGHGGVLDRLDGMMFATLCAFFAFLLAPGLPAQLYGAP